MTQYTKPDDLPVWAETGDKVQPTNPEIQAGWPVTVIPPSRQRFNWILGWLAQGVRYFMQRGIPEWDATEDYPQGAKTIRNGVTYSSLSGTGNINKDPDSEPTFWEVWGFNISSMLGVVDGYYSKDVAGGVDVTLTAVEASNGIITLYGILTANINVIVPATPRRWTFVNSTTGNYSVTVKTNAGTGVVIKQGAKSQIHADGTNVDFSGTAGSTAAQFDSSLLYATTEYVKKAQGNLSGSSSLNASATLNLAQIGNLVVFYGSTAGQTITLPDASTVPAGFGYPVVNQASVTMTLKGNGTQNINANSTSGVVSANTLSFGSGDAALVVSDGVSAWNTFGYPIISSLEAVTAGTVYAGNSGVLSTPATGYVEIANYRVIQGGTIRCYFELTSNAVGGNGHARIYKNGVAYGTARMDTDNAYNPFTEDLVFAAGDTIQIYAYCTGAPSATLAYVKDILFGATQWIAPPVPLTIGKR